MGDKILEVENLTKSYDKSKLVLNNLSFSLEKGEVVVIVGPSGCGKSTFLRCLNKLEEIDSGKIVLNGKEISSDNNKVHEIREKIGMVFQRPSSPSSCFMVERICGAACAVPFSSAAADTGISVNIIATNKTIDNARFLI